MSQDPLRLLDDPSAPAELRADLAEAGREPFPGVDPAGLGRLRAAMAAQVGVGAGAGAAAKGAALAHGSWWGGALIGIGIGLVGAGVIWFSPLPSGSLPVAPAVARIDAPAVAAAASIEVEVSAPLPRATVAAAATTVDAATHAALPRAMASLAAPEAAVDSAAEELALLVKTKERAGSDPAGALGLAEEGNRRFPRGGFVQERELIAILCLRELGRAGEARERAQRFVEGNPGSPYAERLRGVVKGGAL